MTTPKARGQKRQKTPFSSTQLLFSLLRLETSFFVLLSPADPCGGWKWRIKTRARENKPSCNQVSEHCSPPITTLLDKSLFSLHTVSTWCYHFSLNSIKSPLSSLRWKLYSFEMSTQFCASFPYESAFCNMTCWNAENVLLWEAVMNTDHY